MSADSAKSRSAKGGKTILKTPPPEMAQGRFPVLYVLSADPVSAGLADSLARPRGNMTGLTFMAAELNGKRLEMLRDIVPDLRRVAIVANSEHGGAPIPRKLDGGWG